MQTAVMIVIVFAISHTMGQDADTMISQMKVFHKRINDMTNDMDNLGVDVKYLKIEIVSLLPETIRNTIKEMIKTGELGQLAKRTEVRELQAMKRTVQQMKFKLNQLTAGVSRTEQERRHYRTSANRYERELRQLKHQSTSSPEISTAKSTFLKNRRTTAAATLTAATTTPMSTSFTTEVEVLLRNNRTTHLMTLKPPSLTRSRLRGREISNRTEDNYSLLVARRRGKRFSEVDLRSLSVRRLPIMTNEIFDVVYNPKTENLIWSNYSNYLPGIYSANLDGTEVKLISRTRAKHMALDSLRSRLFYTSWSSSSEIMSINLNSGSETKLTTSQRYLSDGRLCLHTRRELLFVRKRKGGILQVNYNGSNETVLLNGLDIYGITTDEDNDVLYCSFKDGASYIINRYSLLTSKLTFVLRRYDAVTALRYLRNLLFIARRYGRSELFNVKTNSTARFNIDLGRFPPAVCYIPKRKS